LQSKILKIFKKTVFQLKKGETDQKRVYTLVKFNLIFLIIFDPLSENLSEKLGKNELFEV